MKPRPHKLTYRTLPRSDGRTSLILTADPGRPEDPEVVRTFPTPSSAVTYLLDHLQSLARRATKPVRFDIKFTLVPYRGRASATGTVTRLGPPPPPKKRPTLRRP